VPKLAYGLNDGWRCSLKLIVEWTSLDDSREAFCVCEFLTEGGEVGGIILNISSFRQVAGVSD